MKNIFYQIFFFVKFSTIDLKLFATLKAWITLGILSVTNPRLKMTVHSMRLIGRRKLNVQMNLIKKRLNPYWFDIYFINSIMLVDFEKIVSNIIVKIKPINITISISVQISNFSYFSAAERLKILDGVQFWLLSANKNIS
jgi:hypothetical protein